MFTIDGRQSKNAALCAEEAGSVFGHPNAPTRPSSSGCFHLLKHILGEQNGAHSTFETHARRRPDCRILQRWHASAEIVP